MKSDWRTSKRWPEEHCKKAPDPLGDLGADPTVIHGVVLHAGANARFGTGL